MLSILFNTTGSGSLEGGGRLLLYTTRPALLDRGKKGEGYLPFYMLRVLAYIKEGKKKGIPILGHATGFNSRRVSQYTYSLSTGIGNILSRGVFLCLFILFPKFLLVWLT